MSKRWIVGSALGAVAIAASVVAVPFIATGADAAGASPTATSTPVIARAVIPEVTSDRDVPEVSVTVTQGAASATLDLRVAANSAERGRGLMWITSMPANEGMLFVFPNTLQEGFWMANTYLPLDIAFISQDGDLISVVQGKPLDLSILSPGVAYRYTIETNVGWWAAHGFSPGAHVAIPQGLEAS